MNLPVIIYHHHRRSLLRIRSLLKLFAPRFGLWRCVMRAQAQQFVPSFLVNGNTRETVKKRKREWHEQKRETRPLANSNDSQLITTPFFFFVLPPRIGTYPSHHHNHNHNQHSIPLTTTATRHTINLHRSHHTPERRRNTRKSSHPRRR